MMKNRPTPYFTIEGTVFEVCIEKQVLIERANPENVISFIDQMIDKGTHYELVYDIDRKNEYDKAMGSYESEDWAAVRVPPLVELDPEGMAEKYGYTVAQLQGRTDFDIIVDPELLTRRMLGALPVINICGTPYYADVRLQELRAVDEHWNRIDLKRLDISSGNENYLAFYHPETRQAREPDPGLTSWPDGVVLIEIPKDLELDPVAVAREYGMERNDVLRRYPIQKNLKATEIPLNETGIPEMIKRNLEKQVLEQQQNSKQFRPKRPRF